MAVPKSKISNSRRGMRRSHIKLNPKNLIEDKDSGEIRLSHHVDMTTGMYNGKKFLRQKLKSNLAPTTIFFKTYDSILIRESILDVTFKKTRSIEINKFYIIA